MPHAGYVYSGQTAAHAYRALSARKTPPSRVVLIGPCHRVAISGLALPTSSAFETPLGKLEVDRGALAGALDREAYEQAVSYASEDLGEGLRAASEKRKPAFSGR